MGGISRKFPLETLKFSRFLPQILEISGPFMKLDSKNEGNLRKSRRFLVPVWNPLQPRGGRVPKIGSEPLTPPPLVPRISTLDQNPEPGGGGRKPTASEPLTPPPFHAQTLRLHFQNQPAITCHIYMRRTVQRLRHVTSILG